MRARYHQEDLLTLLTTLPTDRTTPAAVCSAARSLSPGVPRSAVVGALARAVRSGDVERVYCRALGTTLISLTPLGASRLRVRLAPDSSRWVADVGSEGCEISRSDVVLLDPADDLLVSAPDRDRFTPLGRVIAVEDDELRGRATTLFILLGLSTWLPLPKRLHDPDSCPMHPGRRPRGREYCLWCEADSRVRPDARPPRVVRLPS